MLIFKRSNFEAKLQKVVFQLIRIYELRLNNYRRFFSSTFRKIKSYYGMGSIRPNVTRIVDATRDHSQTQRAGPRVDVADRFRDRQNPTRIRIKVASAAVPKVPLIEFESAYFVDGWTIEKYR